MIVFCSVVDRHRFDVDQDPTFPLDADPDLDLDPIARFTHVGQSEIFWLLLIAMSVLFLVSVIGVKFFGISDSLLKFFRKK